MPEIIWDQLVIQVEVRKPSRAWDYLENEYYDKDSGELIDPETMPPEAKGHYYTVHAVSTNMGDLLIIKNVLRAWDKESIPVVEEFDGRPYDPYEQTIEATQKIVAPTAYLQPTVAIPLRGATRFKRAAKDLGWDIVDLTWKGSGMERLQSTLRALEKGQIAALDAVAVLEHYAQIQANPADPDLKKDFKAKRHLTTYLARLRREIQKKDPDLLTSEQESLEAILLYLKAVFPWARKAELEEETIVIPLGKGTLQLSLREIMYEESGKLDGITAKKGGRLDSLLEGTL